MEVRNLSVAFKIDDSFIKVTDDISFSLSKGEALAVVGESGSGKSVTAKAIMKLLPSKSCKILSGEVLLHEKNLLDMGKQDIQNIRGNQISMIFQEPMTSLNPLFTCGNQIMESILHHRRLKKREAKTRTVEMMKLVGIPEAEKRFMSYPHEMSGGMRQRVMIAMALACEPELLIADEPTTALDPTIQAQIVELIKALRRDMNMSVLFITHDLGIVAGNCDNVIVMYAGQIVEKASVKAFFKGPLHPYSEGLLHAVPRINQKTERLYSIDGIVPSPQYFPHGCRFSPRCVKRTEKCDDISPPIFRPDINREVRCWIYCCCSRKLSLQCSEELH
jgi:oligopeptide/dipeptide ABC transporter ATP-binding protein